jgi:hypothetical protein
VKKLISIGVALALLALAVVPGAVAAYDPPTSYAKIPFAIVQSLFDLGVDLVPAIEAVAGELPLPLDDIFTAVGDWAGGPLSWTVDMLAWGLGLGADVVEAADGILTGLGVDLGFPLSDVAGIINIVACGLLTCYATTECTGTFDPCA